MGQFENARLWFRSAVKARIISKKCRAIGADRFALGAHIDEDMRMIKGRACTDAHEFPGTDPNDRDTEIVFEMRYGMIGHDATSRMVTRWSVALSFDYRLVRGFASVNRLETASTAP